MGADMRDRRNPFLALLTMLAVAACVAPAAAGAAAPRNAYVSNVGDNTVSPLDIFTNVVGSPISLSPRPWGIAITPDGSTAYVANDLSATVTPFDTATQTPAAPIAVGGGPRTLGVTPDGSTVYVASLDDSSVTPIDTATDIAGSPIPVSSPHGIAISPDGETAYVTNVFSSSVTPIDIATGTAGAAIPVGSSPYTIAITPDGSRLYVTHLSGSNVTPIDTATNTAGTPIPVGNSSFGVAISPDGSTAYVSISMDNTVVPIDTATDTPGAPIAITSGDFIEGLAVTPDGKTVYATSIYTNTVTPIDTATATTGSAIPVGAAPIAITIAPDQAPIAAFDASADDAVATFDAAAASDPDGTVAGYAWDFGDGQTATGSQPIVTHSYAQPGIYTATLTVTDDEGCSEALVFTGQTASCAGSPGARVTHKVEVTGTAPAARQAIERFTLDGPCVRRARDGKARIGLRLLLAQPGSISVQVDRAIAAKPSKRCPKPNPARRYGGKLRRVEAIAHANTQAVTASVRRRLTRSFELRPGLYRIAVRAHDGDGLTRAAYRWVRVLR